MKFNLLLIIFLLPILSSCDQTSIHKTNHLNNKIDKKYKNTGFALIYNDQLGIKKLDERSFNVFHNSLKKRSFVKITNPNNKKSIIAEIKSNRVKFSSFYNSVISPRIAETLELDLNEPLIEIVLISKNSTFIAKKTKTFDEEKEVAEKAPIDGILISDLNKNTSNNSKENSNKNFSYFIKVADFYYKKTAQLMVDRIKNETNLKNYKIIELSKNNYRVLIGPFNDISLLKESFEKMKSLYFENLEIIKNV